MNADVHVIAPAGALDQTTGHLLKAQLQDAITSGHRHVLVDCGGITFMDSNGFGCLVAALKTTREHGACFALCGVGSQVRLVLELTGTDAVFTIAPDQASYLATLEGAALS
ncbi:STAS domain-containing protein [Synechococcus sp. ATX 2A4]|uniref:STAS domain-containing protein n=1 Tax=Synechococcus sp. ATX 2A4 TaxID=2823727 RepID=UPI0020CCC7A5|nr:STAS domain-containing protein [Synechococcus sp. ATX 2A4]MCP9884014.1 STAS domain-containing protein [Synechococcus sp. ATX 2A4]